MIRERAMTSTQRHRIRPLPTVAVLLAFLLPTAALAADPTPDPAEPCISGAGLSSVTAGFVLADQQKVR
jgi:hypothetical protein